MLKAWVKGFWIGGLLILGPICFVPDLIANWRVWYFFATAVLYMGIQPLNPQAKLGAEKDAPEDRGSVVLLHLVGYASGLLPYYLYLWQSHQGHISPQVLTRLSIAGAACGISGLSFRWFAIHTLGKWFHHVVKIREDHQLIQSGPYRILRHPSYTGALFYFATTPFVVDEWRWIALLWPLWAIAYYRRITLEEKALGEKFGDAYQEYRRKSWALIPFLF